MFLSFSHEFLESVKQGKEKIELFGETYNMQLIIRVRRRYCFVFKRLQLKKKKKEKKRKKRVASNIVIEELTEQPVQTPDL